MGAEAPFEAEGEREIVLRGHVAAVEGQVVGQLGPRRQPAANRIFDADADGKRQRAIRRGACRRRAG